MGGGGLTEVYEHTASSAKQLLKQGRSDVCAAPRGRRSAGPHVAARTTRVLDEARAEHVSGVDRGRHAGGNLKSPQSLFQRQLNSHLPLMQRELRLMDIIWFSVERWNEGRRGVGVGGFKCEY